MKNRISLIQAIINHILPLEKSHNIVTFIEDAPHVQHIDLRFFARQWESGLRPYFNITLNYDENSIAYGLDNEDSVIKLAQEVIRLQQISLTNEKNMRLEEIEKLIEEQNRLLSSLNKSEC